MPFVLQKVLVFESLGYFKFEWKKGETAIVLQKITIYASFEKLNNKTVKSEVFNGMGNWDNKRLVVRLSEDFTVLIED